MEARQSPPSVVCYGVKRRKSHKLLPLFLEKIVEIEWIEKAFTDCIAPLSTAVGHRVATAVLAGVAHAEAEAITSNCGERQKHASREKKGGERKGRRPIGERERCYLDTSGHPFFKSANYEV